VASALRGVGIPPEGSSLKVIKNTIEYKRILI